ncbi:uncharacterized protein CTHT_0047440 [Thermochaetoides thermophila DSM 1495]|uniref:protein-ribulosamine 3-kinase n=1 Tax=Chaetomium thermophilum (strain DSM 1495 / CBS 144.50 / IMI 039719) TaxID=759272 RepID=G0S9W7_CHATD|nr:hypothetical protein CTHT_0047440 [Thermochaetoides thermophila DSM 1495]EGS20228.1 hypothetical protein CTHT_0047440 [Thermochaetoides thermophila DSM 1495]
MSTLLDSVTQSRNAVYEMSCDSQVKKQVVVEGYELIDPAVLDVLPSVAAVLSVTDVAESAWAKAKRIDVRTVDGDEESYFMKVSIGFHGREALKGEFEATSAIHTINPTFCPKPIAWGTLELQEDSHFYLCRFYEFVKDEPDVIDRQSFVEQLAKLHQSDTSPQGKFGFHCTTYNGNLPQDNSWCDSWEEFFSKGLRHVLKVREERAGPCVELNELLPDLFDKVIPRLLRPLETNGRKLKPSLVHGDLWCGNVGVIDGDTGQAIVFDPSSFWAHNEYELGNWRPKRNGFDEEFFNAYHDFIPRSEPVADYDDRNALYALRFNLHAAALFPNDPSYLEMAINEIRRLNEKFKKGSRKVHVTSDRDSLREAQSPMYNNQPRTSSKGYHIPATIPAETSMTPLRNYRCAQ